MKKCALCESIETPNTYCDKCLKMVIYDLLTGPPAKDQSLPKIEYMRADLKDDIMKFLQNRTGNEKFSENPCDIAVIGDYKVTIEYDDWFDFIRVEDKNGVQKLFKKIS